MNMAVIGTMNRDTIYTSGGDRFESLGGILYNLIALSTLLKDEVILYPICNLGHDIQPSVFHTLDTFPNIDRSGIRIVQGKNNHVILTYTTPGERNEFLENRLPALTFDHIEPFLNCDFILINFISGYDLSLPTLRRIRDRFEGTIFVDIQSLILGIAEDGKRTPRRPENWREWFRLADICQLNLEEARIISGQALEKKNELDTFIKKLMGTGPRIILITLGSGGSLVGYRSGTHGMVEHCPGHTVPVVDTTGCGDVFSAGFISDYMHTRDPVAASRYANRAAASNCTLRGPGNLHTLDRLIFEFNDE